MRTKSPLSAHFVIIFALKNVIWKNTESAHDKCKLQKCSICDFNCFQKGKVKVHTGWVHEKKKSYMCLICDYVCSQKFDLKMHTQSVHDNYKWQ